ncbi:MAG: HAMP domain-containing sensor histidine kinase [Caulobacterales bacterium]
MKQAVRVWAKAAAVPANLPRALSRALVLFFWGWFAAAVFIALAAWLAGAPRAAVGGAASLAIAPALIGFILLPRLGEIWAQAALVGAWLLAAIGMAAGTGGAYSPALAVFVIPCAISALTGFRLPWATAIASLIAFAVAAMFASFAPYVDLGPWAALTAAAAVVASGALIALRPSPIEAQRARATSERVAEISHELRTPLTHILGFAEMIQSQIFGPLEQRYVEYAGLIRASGSNLLEMVNSLLDLSKIQAGRYELEYESFDVRAVVHEVIRLSGGVAEPKKITLVEQAPDAPLMVRADARALRQVLINTVGNAVKFTPEGGRVTLAVYAEDGALVLDTSDTGPGIPEAERKRLGGRYEQGVAGARGSGTGLGLALVRALSNLHGGALSFHDAPGGGALVRVVLPILAR